MASCGLSQSYLISVPAEVRMAIETIAIVVLTDLVDTTVLANAFVLDMD